eukprot:c28375_g1_i1 orf=630-2486(+)
MDDNVTVYNVPQMHQNYTENWKVELTPDSAPCTLAESVQRQKHELDDTPEAAQLVFCSFGSRYTSKNISSSLQEVSGPQEVNSLKPGSYEIAISPPKFLSSQNRIQLEMQREGHELQKENFLSLSPLKYEKGHQLVQKPDPFLSLGQFVGQPPPHRVLATLGCSKLSDSVPSRPIKSQTVSSCAHQTYPRGCSSLSFASISPLHVSMDDCSIQKLCIRNERPNPSDSLALPAVQFDMYTRHNRIEQCPEEWPMSTQLLAGSQDHERDKQQPPCGVDSNIEKANIAMKRKPNSPLSQVGGASVLAYQEQCIADAYLEDGQAYHREAKKATKKKRQGAADRLNTPHIIEGAGASVQLHDQYFHKLCMQTEFMKKQIDFTSECRDGQLNMSKTQIEVVSSASSPAKLQSQELHNVSMFASLHLETGAGLTSDSGKQVSELSIEEASRRHTSGLKLFAIPALSQMPKSISSFSSGEPSLPFFLEHSQKLPSVTGQKNTSLVDTSNDADWGKFLALSATPAGNLQEIESMNLLPYQLRFKQLQAFLKQCDDSNQKDYLQVLQSLSSVARSGYAVELEARAIKLSLEEGREINRMKALNVLGKNADRYPNTTPHGPGVAVVLKN